MKNWHEARLSPTVSIRDAIRVIDHSAMQIALVVDENGHLLGTVTDGDIRRGILRGMSLEHSVAEIMNQRPTTAGEDYDRAVLLADMQRRRLTRIPVLDREKRVVGIEFLEDLVGYGHQARDNWVVLMAGGLGSRLAPLTDDCPKPMLQVGNKPLLETIIESFIEHGFRKFFLSVNYLAEKVTDYFGDGSHWGVEIQYLHERQKLGTAGALSLLPELSDLPLIVMNGDVLTKVNFKQLIEFHLDHKSLATMCVREYDFQVPYGVVRIQDHRITGIDEKPIQRFFVNAGIYVLDPQALDTVPAGTFFDMPTLFETLIDQGAETAVFPVREYWLDIGQLGDYHRANGEYSRVFA